MPLPDHAFTIRGGCNCQAVRYKANIPVLSERPQNAYAKSKTRFPMVATDHCNDCRRATANTLPIWMCVPADFLTVSLLEPVDQPTSQQSNFVSDAGVQKPGDTDARRGPWTSAIDILRPGMPASKDSPFVRFYESSKKTFRIFCGRCGTPLMYMKYPMPEGWPNMYDVLLGSFDREDLDQEWLTPEHQCWWDCGVGWIQKFSTGTAGKIPIHPLNNIDVNIEP